MYCQVVYICGLIPARIRQALAELPETLDETYQRTLQEIKNAQWEFAHRLFQFVAAASRPLRVEELAELLAFDFNAEPIPNFCEDWRLEDPVDAVLSTCPGFLAVANVEDSQIIQFSHFSVKELKARRPQNGWRSARCVAFCFGDASPFIGCQKLARVCLP